MNMLSQASNSIEPGETAPYAMDLNFMHELQKMDLRNQTAKQEKGLLKYTLRCVCQ